MPTPRLTAAAALLAGASLLAPAQAVAAPSPQGAKLPYIVTVEDGADARGIARAVAANPNFVYKDAIDGFAARLNGSVTMSGTSMAAPHVAGVAALYKATYGESSSGAVHSWVVQNATAGAVSGSPAGTPNRLLFKSTL